MTHTGRPFADGESPRKGVPSGRKKPLTMSSATPLSCQSDRDLQPVLFSEPERSYAQELAESKRFVERYRGDDRFREQLSVDPKATLQGAGIGLPIEELGPLFQDGCPPSRVSRRSHAYLQEKIAYRDRMRKDLKFASLGLDNWRKRQIERCRWQLGAVNAEAIAHPPAAFELSRGCSVGCWFCGVSAPRLSDIWHADQANRQLWRETLEAVREICGPGAGYSFLYWATDPLDNPDYEQFCLDFYDIFGQFPQTTTALALKDVERTRNLLQLSQKHGCPINRFSVLSRKQLLRIHEQFTPLELLRVELVLQNKESLGAKSAAGKALSEIEGEDTHATTIACVSGFLFNMPDRQVRWVSPCPASSEHPDGYITHDQARFETVDELRSILKQWAAVPARLRLTDVVRWRQDLRSKPTEDGFRLQDHRQGVNFDTSWYPAAERLGELVAEGCHTVEEICNHLDEPAEQTILALQRFHQSAFLEEIS